MQNPRIPHYILCYCYTYVWAHDFALVLIIITVLLPAGTLGKSHCGGQLVLQHEVQPSHSILRHERLVYLAYI